MIQAAGARAPAGKWAVAGTVVLGSFVAAMDVSIVNVAMPQMIGTFGVPLDAITWVAVAYSIAEIIMVTMAAWFCALLCRLGVVRLCPLPGDDGPGARAPGPWWGQPDPTVSGHPAGDLPRGRAR